MDVTPLITTTSAVAAAVTAINEAMVSLKKSFAGGKPAAEFIAIQQNVVELQSMILAIQTHNQQLIDIKRDLEVQIRQHEKWETEAARYDLKQLTPGTLAYALKPEFHSVEPPHWLCPNCYALSKKAIIPRPVQSSQNYRCFQCSFYTIEDIPI